MAYYATGRSGKASCFPGFTRMVIQKTGEVCYIGGSDILPAPLPPEEESEMIGRLADHGDDDAKSRLIEHNLRLSILPKNLTIPVWVWKI